MQREIFIDFHKMNTAVLPCSKLLPKSWGGIGGTVVGLTLFLMLINNRSILSRACMFCWFVFKTASFMMMPASS